MKRNQQEAVTSIDSIRKKHLINRLNSLHYQKAPIQVCLRHKKHLNLIYLKSYSDPVDDENVVALWGDGEPLPKNLNLFDIDKVLLDSGSDTYEFAPVDYELSSGKVLFKLPEIGEKVSGRAFRRYSCNHRQITVTIMQNAITFQGRLLDFSANGVLVALDEGDLSFSWLNSQIPAMLSISPGGETVYSGLVKLLPRGRGIYLLSIGHESTPRYQQKEYRARRQKLVPSPDFVFTHPITGRQQSLKICEVSGLGFSVEERASSSSLIPGLLIRDAQISFTSNYQLNCTVQVVHLHGSSQDSEIVRVGVAILHISVKDHLQLVSLVQQAQDPRAYISNQINTSDLFDFFFESGFIYPSKYAELANRREEVMKSYQALYENGSTVSRHFVYQCSGQILGHFSSLWVYRKTWLSQHHAGRGGQKAGLKVVRAITEYINDSYLLDPANIEFIIGFYQESNRFPRKYFGDYVRQLNDFRKTSLDGFSYLKNTERFSSRLTDYPVGWSLDETIEADILEFNGFYHSVSEGMLPEALDLVPENFGGEFINQLYRENNLFRERILHSLKYNDSLVAIIDIQKTDFGLNLSEITNAIFVYVVDQDSDYADVISYVISQFAKEHEKENDPVMIFPQSYLPSCNISTDKEYIMWCLNVPEGMQTHMAWMYKYCKRA